MRTYDIGDRARVYLALTDINDAPTNGTVTLTVTSPTGVTSTPAVINDSTGQYHADFDLTSSGRWTYRYVSTGAVIAAEVGTLEVRNAPSLATTGDVAGRWRALTADETALAEVLIDDAEAILRFRVPTVDTRIADGTLDPGMVAAIIARSVVRALRNPGPDGVQSRTTSIDDYSSTERYDTARDALYISEGDLDLLLPIGSSGAFSITHYGSTYVAEASSAAISYADWDLNP